MPVLNSVSKLEARGPSLCRPPSPLLSSASPMWPAPQKCFFHGGWGWGAAFSRVLGATCA